MPPYGTKIINIQADLLLADSPNPVSAPNLDVFLQPEKYIESDDPAILQQAQTLRGLTPIEIARSIFDWTVENLRYTGYLPDDRGALYAFKNRQGDCSEFAFLFAAFCRSRSIPARVLGGGDEKRGSDFNRFRVSGEGIRVTP